MGFRELRTFWPSSLGGLLGGLLSAVGVVVAASTERQGLGALMVIAGLVLLLVVIAVAVRLRKPGQPL